MYFIRHFLTCFVHAHITFQTFKTLARLLRFVTNCYPRTSMAQSLEMNESLAELKESVCHGCCVIKVEMPWETLKQ